MRAKDNIHHQHRYSVNNLLLATIILSLLVFQAWNAQPVNAIVGAVNFPCG